MKALSDVAALLIDALDAGVADELIPRHHLIKNARGYWITSNKREH